MCSLIKSTQREAIRVLLVSRDIGSIDTVCQSAQRMSIHVETCCDGASAIRRLCRTKFEGLFVDLPTEQEAAELLADLRQTTSHKGAIAFAILGPWLTKTQAFQAGANFVIDRPVSSETVLRTLRASYPLLVREKRHYYRCPFEAQLWISSATRVEFSATSLNLSESGIAIVSPVSLSVGEKVRLRFNLSGELFLTIDGEVCWADASGRVGLRFVNPTPRVTEALQTWLSARLQELVPAAE